MREIGLLRSGGTPSKEVSSYWNGSIPWFTAKDLKSFLLIKSKDTITDEGLLKGSRLAPVGSIFLLVRGMTLFRDFPVGVLQVPAGFNQDIKALEIYSGFDPHFVGYALSARKKRLMRLVEHAGHGTGRIDTGLLKDCLFPFPSFREQEKIAEILSTWDTAIEQTRKLINAKKRLKKALMQQLLTGKMRLPGFSEDWREYSMGSLFKERKETNFGHLPLLAITGNQGIIFASEIERKDSSNSDKSKYKRIIPGDIGYNTMRMWQGVSAVSTLEGIVSPAYTICIPNDKVNVAFMGYFFKFSATVHLLWRYSQGLVSDTLNLKFNNFSQIKVSIPSAEEQSEVAKVLSTVDSEINQLEKKLKTLEKQKRGLMQKLLTGEIRVKH